MADALRKTLVAIFAILFLAGIGLYVLTFSVTTNTSVSQEQALCIRNIASPILPNSSSVASCSVSPGQWIQFAVNSNYSTEIEVWISSFGSSSHQILLFSSNTTKVSKADYCCYSLPLTSFPITTGGNLTIAVHNLANRFNPVAGVVSTFAQTSIVEPITAPGHPLRNIGYGLIAFSIAAIYFFGWNPRNLATRTLNRLEKRVRRLRGRTPTAIQKNDHGNRVDRKQSASS